MPRLVEVNDLEAKLIEIDENLQRAELTVLQRGQHIEERKRIWVSLYPETKHGGAPGNKGVGRGKKTRQIKVANLATLITEPNAQDVTPPRQESLTLEPTISGQETAPPMTPGAVPVSEEGEPAKSFVEETSETTQIPERTIRRYAQIGEKICREAQELLEGTAAEDKQAELLKIARLKDPELQGPKWQILPLWSRSDGMTDRPPDERREPYDKGQRQTHPAMQDWQRLHVALSHLGREIIAPVRPVMIAVLDRLLSVIKWWQGRRTGTPR